MDIDLYSLISSVGETTASKPTGVTANNLSKVWWIDTRTAEKMLDVTHNFYVCWMIQLYLGISWQVKRMLQYKRIDQHFFMNTFFTHKNKGNSSRGYTCMQLFVTNKCFVHVIPMTNKSEVPMALKMFAKDNGAPDAIICDAARGQLSKEVLDLCYKIGTSIRFLEEGTPWINRTELYIGLLKEAVHEYLKESDCPLVFWDYCAQRRACINNLTARNLFHLEGKMPTFPSLVKMVTYQTYANSPGTNGVTFVNTLLVFRFKGRSLDASLDQQRAKEIRWRNGF